MVPSYFSILDYACTVFTVLITLYVATRLHRGGNEIGADKSLKCEVLYSCIETGIAGIIRESIKRVQKNSTHDTNTYV
jgi:hypothetical protein